MQVDEKALNFSKILNKNKSLKNSKFSRNNIDCYSEPFIFSKTPELNKNSDGEPAAKKPKQNASSTNFSCENCPVFKVSISQLQEDLNLKLSGYSELHSYLCSERQIFQLEKHNALYKLSKLE